MTSEDRFPSAAVALGFGDSTLLENLYGVLVANGVSSEKAQDIKADLIRKLYSPVKAASLKAVHGATQRCTLCPNMRHDASLPAWNASDPKAVFIVESPDAMTEAGKKVFLNHLAASGFSAETSCCTYVTRCTKAGKIEQGEVENCSRLYLFTELQMMRPSVIIPMGALATKVLLGPDAKITELAVKPDPIWLGPWCVMPTLGPNHIANSDDKTLSHAFSTTFKRAAATCGLTKEVQRT